MVITSNPWNQVSISTKGPTSQFPGRVNILGDMAHWSFMKTRSYAALRAADLDWIIMIGYSLGGHILGCSERLALCLRHSARIGPNLLCHSSSILRHLSSVTCHLSSAVRRPPSTVRHPSSVIRHSPSVIRHPPSVIHRLSFVIHHSSFVIRRPLSAICHRSSVISHPSSVLCCTFLYLFITFSVLFPFFPLFFAKWKMYFETIKSSKTNFCWHVQFIENILLLQCLKKETATAKELDLRPLGKVIIFCDRQTKPSYYI